MILQRELNLFKIKDLSDQIFDYLSLSFYDLESQLDSKFDETKKKFDTFADKHFKSSIAELFDEAENIKSSFPEISEKIKESINELSDKFDQIMNSEYFDLSSLHVIKTNLNSYIEKIKHT